MLYHILEYLGENYPTTPGSNLYKFLLFRSGIAVILSLVISLLFGGRIIKFLKALQVGETIRDLGLEGQKEKEGTPTMGGIIIIMAILIPFLLMADMTSAYTWTMVLTTVWLGLIGFSDDYIKVFKKDKKGLAGKFKIVGQVGLGLLVALIMLYNNDITVRTTETVAQNYGYEILGKPDTISTLRGRVPNKNQVNVKAVLTNVPLLKNEELDNTSALDYTYFLKPFMGDKETRNNWAWLIFIPVVIFIVTAVSNAANLTDGVDGLATGVSAIIGATLGILAYVSSNAIAAEYLKILYLPGSEELVIFSACFLGACIGFLWYNSYPAQIFMGDTGSLTIGGIIAVLAILIRKELLIPILCGICLLYTSPSPRDATLSRMPSSA